MHSWKVEKRERNKKQLVKRVDTMRGCESKNGNMFQTRSGRRGSTKRGKVCVCVWVCSTRLTAFLCDQHRCVTVCLWSCKHTVVVVVVTAVVCWWFGGDARSQSGRMPGGTLPRTPSAGLVTYCCVSCSIIHLQAVFLSSPINSLHIPHFLSLLADWYG